MPQPEKIIIWLPREDEHDLAASLGMVEADRAALANRIKAAQHQLAEDHPGIAVVVKRWHVWRVVRTMQSMGVLNTPYGRAAAFGAMASE